MERLDKFLCDCGVGTRSQVKNMVKAGRVTVDGRPEKDGGCKIDPQIQTVCLDGERLELVGRVVFMLNKPAGFVTATEDAQERTVMELLPEDLRSLDLKPVGRLDKATEGLLLFTNDGELLHRLISPKKEVPKLYYARHEGTASAEDVAAFAAGLTLRDGTVCLPAKLEPLGPGGELDHSARGEISPGSQNDGCPGDAGGVPGTQAGGQSGAGNVAPWTGSEAFGGGDCRVGEIGEGLLDIGISGIFYNVVKAAHPIWVGCFLLERKL